MAMATSVHKAQLLVRTCDDHGHKEITSFCKTCKTFICIICGQTTHNGHDWDLIASIAKERRRDTPKECRKIIDQELPRCMVKLRDIDRHILDEEESCDEDIKKLENVRMDIIGNVNKIVDEKQGLREEIRKKENAIMTGNQIDLNKKVKFIEKMASSLESNIEAYSDYDVIEMELDMLTTLEEVRSYDIGCRTSLVIIKVGDISSDAIEDLIGEIEELPNKGQNKNADVIKRFKPFDSRIHSIVPVSDNAAWIVAKGSANLKKVSFLNGEVEEWRLPCFDLITINNIDLIVTDGSSLIRRLGPNGKETVIMSFDPLYPTCIRKTQTDTILVCLMEHWYVFSAIYASSLKPSSRRLVQRMTLEGKILNTYEFQEDGVTRLFTLPWRTAENGNSDICVINRFSDENGELVVMHQSGRVRFIYHGQQNVMFDPADVSCDSQCRIIVTDERNKTFHLLSPNGKFLRYIFSALGSPNSPEPYTLILNGDNVWIGFADGSVKVYKCLE